MSSFVRKLINKYHYSLESIKNRYPCKIIKLKELSDLQKPSEITYIAATKFNIHTTTAQTILEDPLLVEKFHPTDGVKLGFLACGEILLKETTSIDEVKKLYKKIIEHMFQDLK